jgi:hypothetical protein
LPIRGIIRLKGVFEEGCECAPRLELDLRFQRVELQES